ncbi:MAG TPA: glyoxalase [Nocardioides sp.]|nr:glyoxalase [Nocardioides sp.]
MTTIASLTIEADDVDTARSFYTDALGVDAIRVRHSEAPTEGFRGFTVSLITSQPGNATALLDAAVAAGARVLKPAKKSFWGFGGVVQAPDGTVVKVASSAKKDTAPVSRSHDEVVLLLGVSDMSATKDFYVDQGLTLGKSYGSKYAEFASDGAVKLALYPRKAAAKDAGVPAEGSGSHRLVVDSTAGGFADPDGFVWE